MNLKSKTSSLLGLSLSLIGFQAFGSDVIPDSACIRTLNQARSLAWESLLTDGSDIESPLALVREEGLPDSELSALIRQAQAQGKFSVKILEGEQRAERGEKASEAFIFEYRIRTLSDHIFTVVVPFQCQSRVYNYGFN